MNISFILLVLSLFPNSKNNPHAAIISVLIMHPPEETQAVLSLFDGEISIYEKENSKGKGSFLRIRKMMAQKYAKDEVSLTEE